MAPISFEEVRDRHREPEEPYLEFLRQPSMSLGRYVIPAGGSDTQTRHTEDEVYYVLDGRGRIRIGDDEFPVGPDDVIFVEKHVEHRFIDVETALDLLVVFAPAEGTYGDG